MPKISVVAAVVDTKQLTLYKADGETVAIPQGDPRIRPILDKITPIVSQGGTATISLDAPPEPKIYRDFEQQTGGFARFFKVAKSKVASFFGVDDDSEQDTTPVEPTQVGVLPTLSTAIDDIIANAKPADNKLRTNETIVAVVGDKVIPGMENLKDQFRHASKLGSTKGVENFLRRISAVIDQRKHSIHDLLRFMERGDLPIADDGSIIIYKILRRKRDDQKMFVDCHTSRVPQRVGSYVCMAPEMVDPNRRNECSNGLHVARRGYLGNFSGDVCVLAKVAPEDVIAVPNYDANKMRVCGYHILFELSDDDFKTLKRNRPMTENPAAQKLLGRAIAGDHPRPIEEVRITEGHGGGVVVTPLDGKGQPIRAKVTPAKAIDDTPAIQPVDPKAVAKEVTEVKTQVNGRQQKARALFDDGNIADLLTFKRLSKVSWASLGFSEAEQQQILQGAAVPKPAPKPASKPAPTVKAPPRKAAPVKAPPPAPSPAPAPAKKGPGRPVHAESTKARIFGLDKIYRDTQVHPGQRAKAALELVDLRAKAKKSWPALGYPKLTDQILRDDAQKLQKQALEEAKAQTYPDTNAGRARQLFDEKKWSELRDFQRSRKKSFEALGFKPSEIQEIKLHIGG